MEVPAASIKELYEMLRVLLGSRVEPTYEPGTPEEYSYVADISKAKSLLGYSPSVDLCQGVSRLAKDALASRSG